MTNDLVYPVTHPLHRGGAWLCMALLLWCGWASAETPSPQALVKETSERIIGAIHAQSESINKNPGALYKLVDEIVLPHFDFTAMARLALGKNWRTLNADQQKRFSAEFRALLVRTYAASLSAYQGQTIAYPPPRGASGGDEVTVRTEVAQAGGLPAEINYRLRRAAAAWKVVDVTVDGVSLITNYRASFANEMRQGGIEKLIKKLAERNRTGAS